MAPKKIRFSLPLFISEVIDNDVKKFGINKNKLANMIFEKFYKNYKLFKDIEDENNITFQFNLNNINAELYEVVKYDLIGQDDSFSDLFRSLFYTYINYPADKREIIIYNDVYTNIIKGIEEKNQISIKYNGGFRIIEPFFISSTNEERFNYVCCYSYKNERVVNYRLSKIERVILLKESQKNRNEEEIISYKKNFDPYLSHNKKVKIRLTKRGQELYQMFTFTPKVLEIIPIPEALEGRENGVIYIVEASTLKTKLFFPQFMQEVEILEPVELRDWFRDSVRKMFEVYGGL
jgi:hypothetical protein